MKPKNLIIFGILIFLLPFAKAEKGSMKLLAVTETADGYAGGVADLFLEIKPGTGRVFLETFPLTKVDTQVSTRFAKQIACDFADRDCSKYDFFYAITADSSIIAGPSAGAAIAVLTFSLIKNVEIDENVAITGTINSGGLIGPVGGLKAKIEAGSKLGLKKVLIPLGEILDNESLGNGSINKSGNGSFSLESLAKKYKIEVKEISTLDEAVFEFTGKRFREKKTNLTISQNYRDTMKMLATELCSRSDSLKNRILNFDISDNRTKQMRKNAMNLSIKGKSSFQENMYYSAASYCFGANVEFNYLLLLKQNFTEEGILESVNEIRGEIKDFDQGIENRKIRTITDLESYMVVKERLIEANDFLSLVVETLSDKNTSLHNLAYAMERINSAKSWSMFLKNTGKEFNLNNEMVKNACKTKLSEVEERLQYIQLYLPQNLANTRKELDYAYQDLQEGNHELCLFKASKAKANVDTILSVLGVKNNNVGNIVSNKLSIVERNLVEETEKGIFPILGYSYFEYANSLKETEPFSSLLYSSYALELSDLDIYFDIPMSEVLGAKNHSDRISSSKSFGIILIITLIIGIVLGIFVANLRSIQKKKRA